MFLCWSVVSVTCIDFISTYAHFVHNAGEILFEAFQVQYSYSILYLLSLLIMTYILTNIILIMLCWLMVTNGNI